MKAAALKSKRNALSPLILALAVIAAAPLTADGTYDPKHGRWLQRDPVGLRPTRKGGVRVWVQYRPGSNLYDYVQSRPAFGVDPSGLLPRRCIICCKRECEDETEYHWRCASCKDKYGNKGDEACKAVGDTGMAYFDKCEEQEGPPPSPSSCPAPKECPANFPSSEPTWYRNSANWCADTEWGQKLHGKRTEMQCYREITVGKGRPGCPAARHTCFDKDTNCIESHTDSVGICEGKNPDGTCNLNFCCWLRHMNKDVLGPPPRPIPTWPPTVFPPMY